MGAQEGMAAGAFDEDDEVKVMWGATPSRSTEITSLIYFRWAQHLTL